MREESFRRSQEEGLRLAHIAPLNALVDDLRTEGRGWVPYLAPMYGGVEAEMLAILRDPGPMTDSSERGSGFLCLENDDPAAELYASLLDEAGIAPSRMVAWNAYPWYINRKPTSAELAIGVGPLKRLLDRLPRLRVVLLHGGDAQAMWLKLPLAIRTWLTPTVCCGRTTRVVRRSSARKTCVMREWPIYARRSRRLLESSVSPLSSR
jgi:hypothetical protein